MDLSNSYKKDFKEFKRSKKQSKKSDGFLPPIEAIPRNKDENPQEFEEVESNEEQSFRNEEEPVGRLLDNGPRVDLGKSISRSARSLRSSR